MLPLVLGGIALAAVGYGVKEYCEEEGCPWDDTSHTPSRSKSIEELLAMQKNKIFKQKLPELEALLLKVSDKFISTHKGDAVEALEDETIPSKDAKKYMQIQKSLLDDAEDILHTYSIGVSALLDTKEPYDGYSKKEKTFVKKAYKVTKQLHKYLDVALYDEEGEVLSKSVLSMLECREVFQKHEMFLSKAKLFDASSVGLGSVFAHVSY